MSHASYSQERVSLLISDVLNDIGISNEMVTKRRELYLLKESVLKQQEIWKHIYFFGSQTEVSTTPGLKSDEDLLFCLDSFDVINDWADWKQGAKNLLMVRDCATPGYCFLQLLKEDLPLPASFNQQANFYTMDENKIVLKQSAITEVFRILDIQQHGPAGMITIGQSYRDRDAVGAFSCDQYPTEGIEWLHRSNIGGWPSPELKAECKQSGCLVVPVESKINHGFEELEWRISTSRAERLLMFSLKNIHIKCYVLMKLLIKSYPALNEKISTFMCKTALFHSVERTHSDFWRENNLVFCLNHALRLLYNFVFYRNCPHFMVSVNNLLAGRISAYDRESILEVLQHVLNSGGKALLEVRTDNFGERIQMKADRGLVAFPYYKIDMNSTILSTEYLNISHSVLGTFGASRPTNGNTISDDIRHAVRFYSKCLQHYPHSWSYEQQAHKCMIPLMCSVIGSLLASYNVTINKPLTRVVFDWLEKGLKSDVSSGFLRLATVCYSSGELDGAELVLRHVDCHYDRNIVTPVSPDSKAFAKLTISEEFRNAVDQMQQVSDIRHFVSYCVVFRRGEYHIVPQEIQREFPQPFHEGCQFDYVLINDVVIVDSLTYLYFLQYKTYWRLGNRDAQNRALASLQQCIRTNATLLHKTTSLNLLGQILEQENRPDEAYNYYERSLQIRPRGNPATSHISRLLET
ncbi:hypothetical protein ACF0H5_000777 [Mactra antiquata]